MRSQMELTAILVHLYSKDVTIRSRATRVPLLSTSLIDAFAQRVIMMTAMASSTTGGMPENAHCDTSYRAWSTRGGSWAKVALMPFSFAILSITLTLDDAATNLYMSWTIMSWISCRIMTSSPWAYGAPCRIRNCLQKVLCGARMHSDDDVGECWRIAVTLPESPIPMTVKSTLDCGVPDSPGSVTQEQRDGNTRCSFAFLFQRPVDGSRHLAIAGQRRSHSCPIGEAAAHRYI